MKDNKPGLIKKWVYKATDVQIYHATSYIQSKGIELPFAPNPRQSLIYLFTGGPTQMSPYSPEKWILFQKMTAHCRQVKHTLHSGKVKLSASIGREYKEKLERVAQEMNISKSAVLELLIENADKIKSKQKKKGSSQKPLPINR
ncbi:hypothetical protein GCM10022421_26030 [Oceanisphaera sediminis]|uniref:Ribbon-helix-helix protein CopG domain-containing protein n=1 Tax=Oceanisphaera sediminis TaxID=981381 RepID=A0ABP7ECJ8_9GAMM